MRKLQHIFKLTRNYSWVQIGLIFIISIPTILPYFHPGFFPTHDGEWAVVRLSDMFRELKDHQLPVRYSGNLNYGYGYPLFNFAYPFPYYFGFVFHFLKLGFVDIIKLLFAITVPLSAVFIFLAAKKLWKNNTASFFISILYIFLPYRFVDLYARGSIGESFAFMLYPLLLYFLLQFIFTAQKTLYGALYALSLTVLITSHNIMAVYFVPIIFAVLLSLFYSRQRKETLFLVGFTALGLIIAAFFWVPALLEKNFILLSKIPIADRNINWVRPLQFVLPKMGYSTPNQPDGFSYQLGFPQLILFLFSALLFITNFIRKKSAQIPVLRYLTLFFILLTASYIFLLFPPSNFFWQQIPLLSEINYPWTLLLPIGFLTCLLSGYLFTKGGLGKYAVIFLSLVAIVVFLPYAKPVMYFNRGEGFYFTNDATTTSSREYTPLWVKALPTRRPDQKILSEQNGPQITNVIYNSKMISFTVSSITSSTVRVNTIYYPGWKFFIDKKPTAISYNNNYGVMYVAVLPGTHFVSGIFTETVLRLTSDVLTLFGLLIALGIFVRQGIIKIRFSRIKLFKRNSHA